MNLHKGLLIALLSAVTQSTTYALYYSHQHIYKVDQNPQNILNNQARFAHDYNNRIKMLNTNKRVALGFGALGTAGTLLGMFIAPLSVFGNLYTPSQRNKDFYSSLAFAGGSALLAGCSFWKFHKFSLAKATMPRGDYINCIVKADTSINPQI